jgi:catechol 2,3-dioxygenase
VGRESELELLDGYLGEVRQGQGRLVAVTAEPGIGKSRLVEEFCARHSNEGLTRVHAVAQSFGQTMPYSLLAGFIRSLLFGEATDGEIHPSELRDQLISLLPERSVNDAFVLLGDVLGMEVEAEAGQSVYLRGWGDSQRYSLKLTESPQTGLGHVAIRAWNGEALQRVVRGIEATGRGDGWIDGDLGHGPAYRFTDPDGHVFELLYEAERYEAPPELAPSLKNQPQRYTGRGAGVKRLDHVNLLAADVRAAREFATDVLGYRLYERVELDDGSEAGAWMSLSVMAHELIYTRDHHGANGRLHHLAFWVDTREECLRAADLFLDSDVYIEAAPSKHAIAQGFFLYAYEPSGNRIEVTTGGRLVYDPDEPTVVWTQAERAKGQAWGVKTIESFHTYGTPPI